MSTFVPSVSKSILKTGKSFLGLNGGGGGGVETPKKQKELGLLSLSELIALREEPGSVAQLTQELAGLESKQATLKKGSFTRGAFGQGLDKIKATKKAIAAGQGRLGEINTRIKELTRQRVTARSTRAGSIATLLGRGR